MIERVRRWAPVLGKFAFVQLSVQALSALGGIIIVRALSKEDYAYFTIANSTMLALIALINSGVTYGASGIGGRIWQDRHRLVGLVRTAHHVSRGQTLMAIFPLIALFAWLLRENGASIRLIVHLSLLVVIAAAFQLSYSILVVVPRLLGAYRFLQRIDILAITVRLALIAGATVIFFDPTVLIAIFTAVYCGQWLFVRSWIARHVGTDAIVDRSVEAEMRKIVRRQWLNEVYAACQGQVSVFLLSAFGTATSVADLGALTRFYVIFAALGATMQAVVLPSFARCQDPHKLRRLYLLIVGGNAIIGFSPVAFAAALPTAFLWLLGAKYMQLSWELLLVSVSAGFGVISGATYGLNTSRAWIYPGWIVVPFSIATQILLVVFVGASSLQQVLWMQLLTNVIAVVTNLVTAVVHERRFSRISVASL